MLGVALAPADGGSSSSTEGRGQICADADGVVTVVAPVRKGDTANSPICLLPM